MIIKPIENGTRIRAGHTTFAGVLTSKDAGTIVEGEEVWEAEADGNQVKKGDKWLHVARAGGVAINGWMAIIHLGFRICEIVENSPDPIDAAAIIAAVKEVNVTVVDTDGKLWIVKCTPVSAMYL